MKSTGQRIKEKLQYMRSSGEGYCRDCAHQKTQKNIFGTEYLRCVHVGLTQEKQYEIQFDFVCLNFTPIRDATRAAKGGNDV